MRDELGQTRQLSVRRKSQLTTSDPISHGRDTILWHRFALENRLTVILIIRPQKISVRDEQKQRQ